MSDLTPAQRAAVDRYKTTYPWRMSLRNGRSKITPQQRYEIGLRYREGESAKDLAAEYGVTISYVHALASR